MEVPIDARGLIFGLRDAQLSHPRLQRLPLVVAPSHTVVHVHHVELVPISQDVQICMISKLRQDATINVLTD